ncbi:MAG: cytochrome c oxidase subunit 3 [Pseudomonadales bacterium]
MEGQQSYYVPESSKLAICMATAVAVLIYGAAGFLNNTHATYGDGSDSTSGWLLLIGLAGFCAVLAVWFGKTIDENMRGLNNPQLKQSYALGMIWFIASEVMFFACFFGVLWYVRNLAGPWLAGEGANAMTNEILWQGFQYNWPMLETPQQAVGGVASQVQANAGEFIGAHEDMAFPGFAGLLNWIPFWNTSALLASSFTVHIAHGALKNNQRSKFNLWLGISLALAFIFVALQVYEYYEAYAHLGLTLESGIYGSTFFILTGFHGFHVCMGAIMLTVQWLRSVGKNHFSAEDQFGFEASSWYWHFVDVVWVGLVLFVYVL